MENLKLEIINLMKENLEEDYNDMERPDYDAMLYALRNIKDLLVSEENRVPDKDKEILQWNIQHMRKNLNMYGWKVSDDSDGIIVHTGRSPIKISNKMIETKGYESCIRYCKAIFTTKKEK